MGFFDVKAMAKKEVLKIDVNKNKIPDAIELLDAAEAAAVEAEKAADEVQPYLDRIDAADILGIITLLDRGSKYSIEEKNDFAAKGAAFLHAMGNLGEVAHAVKETAEAVENELLSK